MGSAKTNVSEPLLTCRKLFDGIGTGVAIRPRDEPGGCPGVLAWWCPACRRRERGLLRLRGTWEGVPVSRPCGVGLSAPGCAGLIRRCGCAGGSARSSGDGPVIGSERRGRLIGGRGVSINRPASVGWEELMVCVNGIG